MLLTKAINNEDRTTKILCKMVWWLMPVILHPKG